MNIITRNPETNKIQYHSNVSGIMFDDIFKRVHNVEELKFILLNLCASMKEAANDWYSDNIKPYVDPFCVNYDHCLDLED